MHTTCPNLPYYFTYNPSGSQCSIWRRRIRPLSSKKWPCCTLVGDINDRVAVFEEYRVVLKAVLIQLQGDMRYKSPGYVKV